MAQEIDDFVNIEAYLSKFVGGKISLSKDYYQEGIAIIFIDNPLKKNAITGKMMVDLRNCIRELENWTTGKGVLICGKGDNFSSGGDLEFARQSGAEKKGEYMSSWMTNTLTRLSELNLISVCLAKGPTVGGGAEISVFCDYIVAAKDVTYGFVEGKMGIITAWGGGTKLIQKMGIKKASKLLLTSKMLSAEDCANLDLVDKIVSSDNSFAEGLDWLRQHLIHHYTVTRSFKKLLTINSKNNYNESLLCEIRLTGELWGGDENKKMLAKQIKHRKN